MKCVRAIGTRKDFTKRFINNLAVRLSAEGRFKPYDDINETVSQNVGDKQEMRTDNRKDFTEGL